MEANNEISQSGDLTDRVLVLFSEMYVPGEYDRKPLPCDIFTQDKVIRARQGQAVGQDRLVNSWIWADKAWLKRLSLTGPTGVSASPKTEGEAATAKEAVPLVKTQSKKVGTSLASQGEFYQEDSAEVIENRVNSAPFEPFPVVKTGFVKNIRQFKEVFKRNLLGHSVVVSSKANKAISENITAFLDSLLDHPFHAADYIELLNSTRSPSNHNTFAHSSGTVFYSLAICKKLKMLKDDFRDNKNIGRWVPVKTQKYPRSGGAVPFSLQLAKSFDNLKAGIEVKYQEKERVCLREQMFNLMHQYSALDMTKDWPSMRVDYSLPNRLLIGMGALNADIGKLMIPNEVLNKPCELDNTESGFLRSHPLLGIFLMKEVKNDNPRLLAYILGHHRLLPTGYPPLKNNIFFESRIIGISDMYDGARAPKAHREAMSHEQAILELEKMYVEGAFDAPLWVAAQHVFAEYNHDLVTKRNKQCVEPSFGNFAPGA